VVGLINADGIIVGEDQIPRASTIAWSAMYSVQQEVIWAGLLHLLDNLAITIVEL
jgi:hypothetical protein